MATGKTRKIGRVENKDTRGLPIGLDPRMFYEYSSQQRRQQADGLEGLLYKLLPFNLIGSLAFAIDPFSRFKISATRISPTVRVRKRFGQSLTGKRFKSHRRHAVIRPYPYNPTGTDVTVTDSSQSWTQDSPIDRSDDITALDRPFGSDMGEFASWRSHIYSPPRHNRCHDLVQRTYATAQGQPYVYLDYSIDDYTMSGSAAWIPRDRVETCRNEVRNRALAAMQKNGLGLYLNASSQKKATTLFRNAVELRDLPKSVLQLQETLVHLREFAFRNNIPKKLLEQLHSFKTSLKDVPKEYLSYAFGWRQTYSDLQDLLLAPERITKRINFLIRRNGKATTYRSQRKIADSYSTSSGFVYDMFQKESEPDITTFVVMEHTLKMVVNSTFEFPTADMPTFRRKEFLRQLGVVPSVTDLYNLTPWTWLFDWFTGFGNYLEVIERINSDKELINWGLLTCVTEGDLKTTMKTKISSYDTYETAPTVVTTKSISHTSVLNFSHHLRRDVSTLLNVGTAANMSSLSTYQQTILGALLATKTRF